MSTGRPRATSRDTIAEAACELFLEQGFDATTVVDITRRAGVSRSSFFNYFTSKSDVFWAGLDERIAALSSRLNVRDGTDAAASVRAALLALGEGFAPDSLALALVNSSAMGLHDELEREAGVRRSRIASAVAGRVRPICDAVQADVVGAAYGGAVLAAVTAWAHAGASLTPLSNSLAAALDVAARTLLPPVPSMQRAQL